MLASLLAVVLTPPALVLGSPFQDHMVLQQRSRPAIWGTAAAGVKVRVDGSWGESAESTAGPDGRWMARIKTPAAGGPFTLTVKGGGTIEMEDVLIGEVWLCSGQSNMEMTVQKGYPPPLPNQEQEIATANYPQIRMFNVTKAMTPAPQSACGGEWLVCSPKTVGSFSAAGYFFARELHQRLKVPIGMIHPSWGGTPVEFWMSEAGMRAIPEMGSRLEEYRGQLNRYDEANERRQSEMEAKVKLTDSWGSSNYDDSAWAKESSSPAAWGAGVLKDLDGYVWYRADFDIEDPTQGGTLNLGRVDDADETFINGKRVGGVYEWSISRTYTIPKEVLKKGRNVLAVRVRDDQGEGGLVDGSKISVSTLGVANLVGNWRWKIALDMKDYPRPPAPQASRWSILYNGMIAPVAPYGIRGFLWYQGEANVGRAYQYRKSFPGMIKDWRKAFGGELPFYFVQIAPFSGYPDEPAAELREAQFMTLGLPKTGMVVTTDIAGDVRDIHPIDKQSVGKRLALLALHNEYGQGDVPNGPLLKSSRIDGNRIICEFRFGDGLRFDGGQPASFMIAGEDGKFVPASAKIENGKLVAWNEHVLAPKALRYGWGAAVIGNLANGAGLPASPFRTDDWPAATKDAKW